jgi:uncharacterized membrane protein YdjX (TVP38/TMEM64 family)
MKPEVRQRVVSVLALVFVIGLSVLLFLNRDRIQENIPVLEALGYPGVFLLSLVANASIILPVPGVLVTSTMGAILNPFWVAVAAGTGSALGELTGYLAGYSGRSVAARNEWNDRIENWIKRYGDWAVLILAIIPNPAFDMVGIFAGALKMPLWRFLLWCWLGKIIKMMAFAYGGNAIFNIFP